MANIKYTSPIKTGKGLDYTFQLYDANYSGAATEVRLSQGGFALTENSEGDDISETIKATSLTVGLLVEDSTMEDYLMSLIDNEEKTVYIVILKGSDYYWGGPVLTDLINIESAAYPFEVQLQACDYLGVLDKIDFEPSSFELLTAGGINLASVFIAEILRKCFPSGDYFYINGTTLFSVASPLYETQTDSSLNIFETTYIDPKAYTDDLGVYTFTYRQVLEDILNTFGFRLKYSDGRFRLVDWRMVRFYTNYEEVSFNTIGAFRETVEYNNSLECTTNPDTSVIFLEDPLNEFDSALSKVQVTLRTNANCRRDFEDNPDPLFANSYSPYLVPKIAGIVYQSYSASTYSDLLFGGNGEYLKIKIKVNAKQEIFPKVKWLYFQISVLASAVEYSLQNSASHPNGYDPNRKQPSDYEWGTPAVDAYVILPFNGSQYLEYTIYTPPLPGASNTIVADTVLVAVGGDTTYTRTGLVFTISGNGAIINLNTTGLVVNMTVTGPGISGGTYVTGVYANHVTLNNGITPTAAGSYLFVDPALYLDSGDTDYINFELDIIYIDTVQGEADNEGVQYLTTNNVARTDELFLPDVHIGDLVGGQSKSTIFSEISGGGGATYSAAWRVKAGFASDTPRALLQKLTEMYAGIRYKPLKKYQGTLLANAYESHIMLIYNDQVLVYNGGTYTAEFDEWQGEWHVFQYDVGDVEYGQDYTGVKNSNKDILKDVYKNVDVPFIDGNLKRLSDVISGLNQQVGMLNPIITEVEEKILNYTASDPQVTIQTTGATPTATDAKNGDIVLLQENGKIYKMVGTTWTQQIQFKPLAAESPNIVFAGPSSGAAAIPTFRALVAADLASGGSSTKILYGDMTWAAPPSAPYIKQNAAAITLGATTALTTMDTVTIPANSLAVGDSIEIAHVWSCNSNANTKQPGIYVAGGATPVTAINALTTNLGLVHIVYLKVTSSTNLRAIRPNTGYGTTSSAIVNQTIDITTSTAIDFKGQKAVSGDTLILEHYAVKIIKNS